MHRFCPQVPEHHPCARVETHVEDLGSREGLGRALRVKEQRQWRPRCQEGRAGAEAPTGGAGPKKMGKSSHVSMGHTGVLLAHRTFRGHAMF